MNSALGSITCTLSHGLRATSKEASIEIKGFGNLNAFVQYAFRIDEIVNPAGGDDKNVITRLELYDSTGTLRYSGINYDYTIIDIIPDTDTALKPNASVSSPGATMVTFDTSFKCSESIFIDHMNDYYIIEWPKPVFKTIASSTECDDDTNYDCFLMYGHN